MSQGQAAATLSLGIRTAPAAQALKDLTDALLKFKSELHSFNDMKVQGPLNGLGAHAREEVTKLRAQMQEMSRSHETVLREMQGKLEAALAKREQSEKASLQKRLAQKRQYEKYMGASHSGDMRSLGVMQVRAIEEDLKRQKALAAAAAAIGPTRDMFERAQNEQRRAQEAGRVLNDAGFRAQQLALTGHMQRMQELNATGDRAEQLRKIRQSVRMQELNEVGQREVERSKLQHAARMAELDARFTAATPASQLRLARLASAYSANGLNAVDRVGSAAAALGNGSGIAQLEATLARLKAQQKAGAGAAHEHAAALNDMHSAARGVAGAFRAMWLTWGNIGPLLAGFAVAAVFRESISQAVQFEHQMNMVAAVTGESREAVFKWGDELKKVAILHGTMPLQAVESYRALAQAGLSTQQALATLPETLRLAALGETDLTTAAKTLTGVTFAFGSSIENLGHVSDVLVAAASKSTTSVSEMSESMKQASTVAQQYKLSIEDVAVGLVALARRNITGSVAGTSFRNFFDEIAAPTEKAKRVMKELNLSFFNGDGTPKDMLKFVDEFRNVLEQYDRESQAKIMDLVANERGKKFISAMLGMSKEDQEKLRGEMQGALGSSFLAFQQSMQSVQSQFNVLKSQWASSFEAVGSGMQPLMMSAIQLGQAMSPAVRGLAELTAVAVNIGVPLAGATLGILGLARVWGVLAGSALSARVAAMGWVTTSNLIGPSSTVAAAGVGTLTVAMRGLLLASGVGAVLVALSYGLGAFLDYLDKDKDKKEKGKTATSNLTESLKAYNAELREKIKLSQQDSNNEIVTFRTQKLALEGKWEQELAEAREKDAQRGRDSKILGAPVFENAAKKRIDAARAQLNAEMKETEALAAQLKAADARKNKEFEDALKAGQKSIEPIIKALNDKSAGISAERTDIQEQFRHETEMAKMWHDAKVEVLRDSLRRELIDQDKYTADKLAVDKEYLDARERAYQSASARIEKEVGRSDRGSQRKQLQNALESDQNKNTEAGARSSVETFKQLGLDENRFKEEARKYSESVAKVVDQTYADIKKLTASRDLDLLSPVEKAGAQARIKVEQDFGAKVDEANRALSDARAHFKDNAAALKPYQDALQETIALKERMATVAESAARAEAAYQLTFEKGAKQAFANYAKSAADAATQARELFTNAFRSMEDALVKFVRTGKLDFKSLADSIINDIIRIQIRQMMTGTAGGSSGFGGQVLGAIGKMFGFGGTGIAGPMDVPGIGNAGFEVASYASSAWAKGGAFNSSDLHQYANTIVSSPTLFRFAKGGAFRTGEMGEVGPEAIMPLARDTSGRLGVRAEVQAPPQIEFKLVNESGTPLKARQTKSDFDGEKYVIGVVLEAMETNPSFRAALGR